MEAMKQCTLRGQMDFVYDCDPVALDEVEPAANIVKRFVTGRSLSNMILFQ